MKRLLLVTISRALCDTDRSSDWMWDTLQWRIKEFCPDILIDGGAEKGDRDATEIGSALGIRCYEYRTDGWIWIPDGRGSYLKVSRWWASSGSVHPLERNRFMVSHCVRFRESGWNVHVLGLVAPWSKTHGTDHTLSQARHSGFSEHEVTRLECPHEDKPEVSL